MRPAGTRAAGAGGSNATMLKLYTDDAPGLKVYVRPSLLFFPTFMESMGDKL